MFDEKSDIWLNIYKGYIQVMFWLYAVAGVVLCILGWCDCIWITDSLFLDGLILLASGAFMAFTHLLFNMLILQFLMNVQSIRETAEYGISRKTSENSATPATVAPVFRENIINRPATNGIWACKNCGTNNSLSVTQCKKCGQYKS